MTLTMAQRPKQARFRRLAAVVVLPATSSANHPDNPQRRLLIGHDDCGSSLPRRANTSGAVGKHDDPEDVWGVQLGWADCTYSGRYSGRTLDGSGVDLTGLECTHWIGVSDWTEL